MSNRYLIFTLTNVTIIAKPSVIFRATLFTNKPYFMVEYCIQHHFQLIHIVRLLLNLKKSFGYSKLFSKFLLAFVLSVDQKAFLRDFLRCFIHSRQTANCPMLFLDIIYFLFPIHKVKTINSIYQIFLKIRIYFLF